ncbi:MULTISPECIES: SGNH/GDSL hydrolase family protein [unclassified Micromonospora]|uniref:SGNH/GDSL hydrolase family protein n=1 Tax=unclassified Micromonospora TaxID=2617518 RepID=UPI0013D8D09E|nr:MULTISPECIES: SGNH/GDSL hydrolase family protein [unclassified Micromonospora]NES15938.1 SGNH/GDSL hydrolase family protein [Micromonospora sp. PPF5-17B]NES58855.1 SGNH/GDSL hydrolase family protein [Micromonospora sp. PPF5-6]
MRWRSYVAVGDSFTEGMDDAYPDGTYRGWADLVATRLAAEAGPDFGYANLAIRGRLFPNVVAEQVPAALAMKPDLISFAAGGNDVLRRTFDADSFVPRFDAVIAELRSGGADVVLFRFADVMARLPGQRLVAPRVNLLNRVVGEVAERHGAILVDLYADDTYLNPLLWSTDRLHLSAAGHRRVAAQVLTALGIGCDEEWLMVPPHPAPTPWLAARAADLRWAGQHLAPWIKRRLTGRSSGDSITAKRPILGPITLD